MSKLQLYITMSQENYENLVDINANDYVASCISNLTTAVKDVDYSVSEKAIFYMIKYIDSGFFIVVIRTIPGELGNHLASWIYIPYTIKISDKEIVSIVNFITRKVSNDAVDGKDIAEMREKFSRSFADDPTAQLFTPCSGKTYAHRFYGGNTGMSLSELIGPYRYQESYTAFAGVLLVDKVITNHILGPNLTNAIKADISTNLPTAEAEAAPHTHNPSASHGTKSDLPERQNVYRFEIPAKSAAIGTVIEFVITTDAKISESPIDGYVADNINEGSAHSNRLHYKHDNNYANWFVYALYAIGGLLVGILATLLFTCGNDSGNQNDAERQDETKEQRVSKPEENNVQKDEGNTVAKETETQKENAQAESANNQAVTDSQTQNIDNNIEAAIKYLDSNTKWNKEEMSKYPDLNGLFDDLNNINYDAIINVWGNKLADSRKFSTLIVKHVSQGKSTKKTPKKKPFTTDTTISVQAYLNNVDP